MILSIGADHVIDYAKEDFTKAGALRPILDNVANRSFSDLRRLTPQGMLIPNSGQGGMGYVIKVFLLSPFMHQQGSPFVSKQDKKDLLILKDLINQENHTSHR
jgi:NADPH:quinone reductase-like Zn-dependent oxidoreductase